MKSLYNFLNKIISLRYMLRNMVIKDIKSRYSGSLLGTLWSILNPVALIATYYFVFSLVLQIRLGPQYGESSFTIWLISGILPWIYFSEVISRSSSIIINNSSLITKTRFPSETLTIVVLISSAFNHLILVSILLLLGFFTSTITISTSLLLIIPYFLATSIFALGLSWIVSAITVYLRDLEQLIAITLNLWFYFTPIIYPIASVPFKYADILKLNPIYYLAEGYRKAFLNKPEVFQFEGYIYLLFSSICACVIGGYVFKKLKLSFADVL